MSTLSKALKIYNVYKTFNETAELDIKTPFQGSSPESALSSCLRFQSPPWLDIFFLFVFSF